MSSSKVRASSHSSSARLSLVAAALLCTTSLAGCSADLARLDMANAGLSDAGQRSGSLVPSEPMHRSVAAGPSDEAAPSGPYSFKPKPYERPVPRTEPVRQAGLPEPVPSGPPSGTLIGAPRPQPVRSTATTAPAAYGTAASGGTVVEVVSGDTLYGIARRHNVSIASLMSANGLKGPTIFPGQKLTLPAGGRRPTPARHRSIASAPPVTPIANKRHVEAPSSAEGRPSSWTGSYTVTARDSLYAIARRHHVKVAELQAVNGITDPARLRAGTVLKVPGSAGAAPAPSVPAHVAQDRAPLKPGAAAAPAPVPPAVAEEAQAQLAPGLPSAQPRIINATTPAAGETPAERVAVAAPQKPVLNDASPAPTKPDKPQSAALTGKFRWPAKGRVIAGFGPRPGHAHNDGINISVPQGSSVVSAEAGTVAYAGNELKGYGNLILIRHEGNWVSAYAHNETLLVRRGDRVERGQEIAKAGKTGAVDQPQVHFELRQGSKPVDPMPYLVK